MPQDAVQGDTVRNAAIQLSGQAAAWRQSSADTRAAALNSSLLRASALAMRTSRAWQLRQEPQRLRVQQQEWRMLTDLSIRAKALGSLSQGRSLCQLACPKHDCLQLNALSSAVRKWLIVWLKALFAAAPLFSIDQNRALRNAVVMTGGANLLSLSKARQSAPDVHRKAASQVTIQGSGSYCCEHLTVVDTSQQASADLRRESFMQSCKASNSYALVVVAAVTSAMQLARVVRSAARAWRRM